MLLMMLITGIDVIGGKLFTWRLLGAIDIVMISQIVAIAFAAACTLIAERHVRVEFIVSRLSQQSQAVFDTIVYVLCSGLFILVIWRLIMLGYSFQTSGETTATIYIPLYFFAYGIALACIPAAVIYLMNLYKAFCMVVRK